MHIYHERVDDIPLIIAYLMKKKIDFFVNERLKNHSNQNNLSNGEIVIIWLAYVLSEGDHRKAHVIDWIAKHQVTLSACMGKHIDINNFTDDRLTRLLYRCSLDEEWEALERDIARETMSLIPIDIGLETYFAKDAEKVIKGVFKLDSTSVSGFHEISEDGLMQYGFSKDFRPGCPQAKIMYCSEGVSGCSLVTQIQNGNVNDECMYEGSLKMMREAFNTKGFLYCGDSKMSVKKIRESMVQNGEFYLCPLQLSNRQTNKTFQEEWIKAAIDNSKMLIQIHEGEELCGYGYEFNREQKDLQGNLEWIERVLIVKSLDYFEGCKKKFDKGIAKAQDEISQLKSKLCKTREEAIEIMQKAIEKKFHKLSTSKELFEIEIGVEEINKVYKRTEVRKNNERSGSYKIKRYRAVIKTVVVQQEIREKCLNKLGWRAFVTNVPADFLSYPMAYSYYRKTQHVIEGGFHILKSNPVGIMPLYVWREDQIKGLIRFLSLSVLFLKLIALELMIALKKKKEVLIGLTAGQPKRKTEKPTAASILNYFYRCGISLSYVKIDNHWKSSLNKMPDLCLEILTLLGLTGAYTRLIEWQYFEG